MSALALNNIVFKRGKEKSVLTNISFELDEKDIFFLIGPNGAGKSTILKSILGLLDIDSGSILFEGVEMNGDNRLEIMRGVGVLIEHASFYSHLTVKENAYLMAGYYDVDNSWADEAIKIVGLENAIDKKGSQLSMGMKQRLGLALSILHKPNIVFLDEPTNGLDPQGVIEFRKLIQLLNKELGVTFFITSHILSEVDKLANKVAIIQNGEIKEVLDLHRFYDEYQAFQIETDINFNRITVLDILNSIPNASFRCEKSTLSLFMPKSESIDSVAEILKIDVSNIKLIALSLEEYYLTKTYNYEEGTTF
jgi:ABC-type multidrug transport system ATPase subunit